MIYLAGEVVAGIAFVVVVVMAAALVVWAWTKVAAALSQMNSGSVDKQKRDQ